MGANTSRFPDGPEPQDARIQGSFPGGPSRRQGGEPSPPTRAVRTMDEVEAGIARRRQRIRERGRRSRAAWTAVGIGILAAALGYGLGRWSHRTPAQLQADAEVQARKQVDGFISREVNRTLLELWRMEDVEALRSRRP